MNPHFVLGLQIWLWVKYITNRDYDLKFWKIFYFLFFKVNQIIMPTSQWHHNKGGIGHLTTLIIKKSLLHSLCSCKIHSWSLRFHQFSIWQVHTPQSSTLLHSFLLNKRAKFSTKIFAHFWDIVIFVSDFTCIVHADNVNGQSADNHYRKIIWHRQSANNQLL